MTRQYDAQGFRVLPFAVERRLPDQRTFQAYGDHQDDRAAIAELVEALNAIPAVERSGHG